MVEDKIYSEEELNILIMNEEAEYLIDRQERKKMSEKKMERRSLQLTKEEWEKLEELAEKLNILAPTSANVGNPSWRSMIKAVAKGELVVFDAEIMVEMEKTLRFGLVS